MLRLQLEVLSHRTEVIADVQPPRGLNA